LRCTMQHHIQPHEARGIGPVVEDEKEKTAPKEKPQAP